MSSLDQLSQSFNSFLLKLKARRIKLFMTGIVDLQIPSLSGMTFSRISYSPIFHTLAGFTEDDVKRLLGELNKRLSDGDPVKSLLDVEKSKSIDRLHDAYNGYWFADTSLDQPKMYNADMVLYFLRYVLDREIPQS